MTISDCDILVVQITVGSTRHSFLSEMFILPRGPPNQCIVLSLTFFRLPLEVQREYEKNEFKKKKKKIPGSPRTTFSFPSRASEK